MRMPLLRYFLVVGTTLTLSLYLIADMLDPGPLLTAAKASAIPLPPIRPATPESNAELLASIPIDQATDLPVEQTPDASAKVDEAVTASQPQPQPEVKTAGSKTQRVKHRARGRSTTTTRDQHGQVYVIRRGSFQPRESYHSFFGGSGW